MEKPGKTKICGKRIFTGNFVMKTKVKYFNRTIPQNQLEKVRGLGLSLAYNIVTKGHDGTITFESKISKGSTFSISIPM
jgi:light-regulated signal transduction histidine kinase (bacteriophytochrome)